MIKALAILLFFILITNTSDKTMKVILIKHNSAVSQYEQFGLT
jgi:hypothetical protein